MKDDCVFCRILKGEAPGTVVHITDNWATLVPKEKVSQGHILVIPTLHCEDITDLQLLIPKHKNIPIFDTMKILADATVREILT